MKTNRRKISFGICLCSAVVIAAVVGYFAMPDLYRATCVLRCTIGRSQTQGAVDPNLQFVVKSELEGYKRRFPTSLVIERVAKGCVVANVTDLGISNAVASCRMSVLNGSRGLIQLEVFAEDRELVEEVVKTYQDTFNEYLEWVKDVRYRKSVAMVQAKIEKARRSCAVVDPQLDNELKRVRKNVEADALSITDCGSVSVVCVGKSWPWIRNVPKF